MTIQKNGEFNSPEQVMSPNIVVKGRWTPKRLPVKSVHWYKWTKHSSQCLFLTTTFSGSVMRKTLSRHENPIEAYRLLRIFLLLTKRLEKCKWEWGMDKLGVEAIDTTKQYKNFWCVFTRYLLHYLRAKLPKLFHWISLYLTWNVHVYLAHNTSKAAAFSV